MTVNSGDDLLLEDSINMLNADQRRMFDKYITISFTNSSTKPINVVVSSNHFTCFTVVLQGLANCFLLKR